MKLQIKNRFSGKVQFECELTADLENSSYGLKLGFAVKKAIETKANLSEADLSWANLSKANLSEADLSEADLSWANLSKADLSKADLSEADLSGADLSWADLSKANLSEADLSKADLSKANLSEADLSKANLSEADLSWANLSEADLSKADLSSIKADVFMVLAYAIPEIPALIDALKNGNVDGSTYSGECSCLVGTIAKERHIEAINLPQSIKPDSSRPAERFFMAIKKGDTPDTNPASKIAMEWAQEFQSLITPLVTP